MTDKSERHNKLTRDFVFKVLSETKSHSEMMVIIESVILAAMLSSHKMYNISPSTSVEMIEHAVMRATQRFTDANKQVTDMLKK